MLILLAGMGQAQENAAFGQALQTKFQARMTSLNALLETLTSRMENAEDYRRGVTECGNDDMFFLPGNAGADANGCVGLELITISGSVPINDSSISNYTIPSDVYSKMRSGTFYVKTKKLGTPGLSFDKGDAKTYTKTKYWDDGWWDKDGCRIKIIYDGNQNIRVSREGLSGGGGGCRGPVLRLDWTGKQIVLDKG